MKNRNTLNLLPSVSLLEVTEAFADEGLFLRWRHFPPAHQSNVGRYPKWNKPEREEQRSTA